MSEPEVSSATSSLVSYDSRSVAVGHLASSLSADVASFVARSMETESASLREHDCALTVLENLERYWFWDNVFNFGTGPVLSGSSGSTSIAASMSVANLEALPSPFRSIEMVAPRATDTRATVGAHGHVEIPRPYLQRAWSALEEREEDSGVQDGLRQRLSLSAVDLDLDASLHLSTDSKICNSSEQIVHDADEESQHAKTPPSCRKVLQPPPTVPRFSKLESIPSDKQFQERKPEEEIQQTTVRRRGRRRATRTRSMTDLESDEVKGFMDLGFKFNMDELSPHVVNVLPGLQRLCRQEKTQRRAQPRSRPYLSEAWLIRRPDSPLLNWRMPSLDEKEVDMKKQLKYWARAVASTVQQES